VYGTKPKPIEEVFSRAQRITRLNEDYRRRNRRHGNDSLYFAVGRLVFVVKNAEIITVEINGSRDSRRLNKLTSAGRSRKEARYA
jgi:hypothetical protein